MLSAEVLAEGEPRGSPRELYLQINKGALLSTGKGPRCQLRDNALCSPLRRDGIGTARFAASAANGTQAKMVD